MKKLLFLVLAMILVAFSYAQDVAYSAYFIKSFNEAKAKSTLPNATHHDHLWKSAFLLEATKKWNLLTEEAKQLVKPGFNNKDESDRPQYADEFIYFSYYFTFHYTLTGDYAIDSADTDQSGDPDYIEWMASLFDNIYYSDSIFGFNTPPADNGYGGDDYYDVYIGGDINGDPAIDEGTYGFVSPEDSIGDNPKTSLVENYSYSSWMCMNYDYSWADKGRDTSVSVTFAHEFMHALQMGYNSLMDTWFQEACATWSEEAHFPGYDDNFQYLMTLFGQPDISLNLDNWNDNLEESPLNDHWYSSWLFIKYLTEQTNDGAIRSIYENYTEEEPATDIINSVLETDFSSSFEELFKNYLIANIAMQSDPAFAPYNYERANDYMMYIDDNGGFTIEGNIDYSGADDVMYFSDNTGNGVLMRLSADYISINPTKDFSITVTPQNANAEIKAVLLGMNTIEGSYIFAPLSPINKGLQLNIENTVDYDKFILLVYRNDAYTEDTLSEQYTILVSDVINTVNTFTSPAISFYPNPVKNQLTFKHCDNITNGQINMYDFTGKLVLSQEYKNNINLSSFENGLYSIELYSNNKLIFKDKILKN